jgi:hypothetical protein
VDFSSATTQASETCGLVHACKNQLTRTVGGHADAPDHGHAWSGGSVGGIVRRRAMRVALYGALRGELSKVSLIAISH